MALPNAFKNVSTTGLTGSEKLSLGAHNSLLQIASNGGYATSSAWGAGIGAAYGGIDGAFSYDGSFFGGAFHGAMTGAAGGAGLKFAADSYAIGAVKSGTASGTEAIGFKSAWASNTAGPKGSSKGAFSLDNFF